MYVCQVTGKQSKHGEKLNKITVATRERTYTRWVRNEETNKWEEVFVAKGWEIVREINASEEGVQLWNSWTPEERTMFLKHAN
jgi:hypothetical protein